MAFTSGRDDELQPVGPGERWGNPGLDLTETVFEDGLVIGRFAKLDTGSLDNMDGSATPVIAGVPLRFSSGTIEDDGVVNSAIYQQVQYRRVGEVTVEVKAGEAVPGRFGAVYASNAGDADDGKATSTGTDVDVNAFFLEEVKAGVWLVYLRD